MSAAEYLKQIQSQLAGAWLPRIYREQILQMPTRAYELPPIARHSTIEIHHTLLGIELKAGRRRMLCPDLATARYLAVFARLGCRQVAIPYDITKISQVADDLESSWHRMLLFADELSAGKNRGFGTRLRNQLIGKVREEINAAGAGGQRPEFKDDTKQTRKPPKSARSTNADRRTAAR